MNVCPVATPPDSNPVSLVKFGQPLRLMSPIGRKAMGVKLDFTPPRVFAAAPTCLSLFLSSVSSRSAYRAHSTRLLQPRTSASTYGGVEVLDIALTAELKCSILRA